MSSLPQRPLYACQDKNGQSRSASLDNVFEEFLMNDLSVSADFADLDGNFVDIFEKEELFGENEGGDGKKRPRKESPSRDSSKTQKQERRYVFRATLYAAVKLKMLLIYRERNREHAKKSRIRRKFMIESMQRAVDLLRDENHKLRVALAPHFPSNIIDVDKNDTTLLAGDGIDGNCSLDNQDYSLVKALQTAQQNFVISDPSYPDNPIVFASHGFLSLTGYSLNEVLGKNCRFLQGPKTDLKTVAKLSEAVKRGDDYTTILLNYRADGSEFWNQLFVAALRDTKGQIVNYLGVQCRVSDVYAATFFEMESKAGGLKNSSDNAVYADSTASI